MEITKVRLGGLAGTAALVGVLSSSGVAQLTLDAEWNGDPAGLWFDPLDPIQLEPEFSVGEPDWSIPGSITIGGITFNTIKFPSNLPGFNFNVSVEDAILAVAPGPPIRVSNAEFGGLASGVTIEAGGSWGVVSGTVDGGVISVNALGIDAIFTDLTINGQVNFTGGGSIVLGDSASSRVTGGAVTTFSNVMILDDYTLSGGGVLGNETMSLRVLANGRVTADATAPLIVDPGPDSNIENLGVLEATGGGTLRLQQTAIVNAGGVIQSDAGSRVLLQDVTVSGGELADGSIRGVAGVTLENNVTNNAVYTVENGTTTILDGTLTNNNQVTLAGGSFLFNNSTTLSGGGTFTLGVPSEGGVSVFAGVGGVNPTVTNADNTIQGGGTLGFMTLINQSQITADESDTPLTVLANAVQNQATMSANGGELNIRSAGFNNAGGLLDATGGTLSITNGGHVQNGVINLDAGSTLRLSDGRITDATINNLGSGTVETGPLGGIINAQLNNGSGGTVRIADDSALVLVGTGIYFNAGTIQFDGTGPFASFANTALQVDGEVTLTGGGTVELGTSGDGTILSRGGTLSTLINADHTIRGAGHLGRNTTEIDNRSAIVADTASAALFIDPGNGGIAGLLTNTGSLEADNGGTLHLLNGTYQNAGGLIQAGTGASVVIDQGVQILGGTVASFGGGTVDVVANDVLFDGIGIDLDADVRVDTLGRLRLKGDINNQQSITLAGQAQLLIDGEVTLTGGGTVDLAGPLTRLTAFIDATPDRLINVDNTLTGTGTVLFLDIESSGTLAPGNSPGTLTINGDYTQTAAGRLQIEIGDDAAGEFDVLAVQGAADLAGTLELTLLAGLEAAAGTRFEIVTASSLSTDFNSLLIPVNDLNEALLGVEQIGNTLWVTALEDLSVPIPEPGTFLLVCFGAGGFVIRRAA